MCCPLQFAKFDRAPQRIQNQLASIEHEDTALAKTSVYVDVFSVLLHVLPAEVVLGSIRKESFAISLTKTYFFQYTNHVLYEKMKNGR